MDRELKEDKERRIVTAVFQSTEILRNVEKHDHPTALDDDEAHALYPHNPVKYEPCNAVDCLLFNY